VHEVVIRVADASLRLISGGRSCSLSQRRGRRSHIAEAGQAASELQKSVSKSSSRACRNRFRDSCLELFSIRPRSDAVVLSGSGPLSEFRQIRVSLGRPGAMCVLRYKLLRGFIQNECEGVKGCRASGGDRPEFITVKEQWILTALDWAIAILDEIRGGLRSSDGALKHLA